MGRQTYESEPIFASQSIVAAKSSGHTLARTCFSAVSISRRFGIREAPPHGHAHSAARHLHHRICARTALDELGNSPQGMLGHSVGEFVAACLAGVFSLEDALALVASRVG